MEWHKGMEWDGRKHGHTWEAHAMRWHTWKGRRGRLWPHHKYLLPLLMVMPMMLPLPLPLPMMLMLSMSAL